MFKLLVCPIVQTVMARRSVGTEAVRSTSDPWLADGAARDPEVIEVNSTLCLGKLVHSAGFIIVRQLITEVWNSALEVNVCVFPVRLVAEATGILKAPSRAERTKGRGQTEREQGDVMESGAVGGEQVTEACIQFAPSSSPF